MYEGHYELFEVLGHFGKDYDAFMDFPAGQPSQSIHPNLLNLGSGISRRMFLNGLYILQI